MKSLPILAAAAALFSAAPADACSYIPGPPPTQEESDRFAQQTRRETHALVAVSILDDVSHPGTARARVTAVHWGPVRIGTIVRLRMMGDSCARNYVRRGETGLVLLHRPAEPGGSNWFAGFLPERTRQAFERNGLLRAQAAR